MEHHTHTAELRSREIAELGEFLHIDEAEATRLYDQTAPQPTAAHLRAQQALARVADDAWGAALVERFGGDAGDARYDGRGRAAFPVLARERDDATGRWHELADRINTGAPMANAEAAAYWYGPSYAERFAGWWLELDTEAQA